MNDILLIVFLAFCSIVIAAIISKVTCTDFLIPTFAIAVVCMWIMYDYILLRREKAKEACELNNTLNNTNELADQINTLDEPLDILDDEQITLHIAELEKIVGPPKSSKPASLEVDPHENDEAKPQAKHENEFDIAMLDREIAIAELHKDMGCTGDTRLANRMKYMAAQPRIAKDNMARMNSEKLRPYFNEELDDNEKAEWWNNENDYLDILM